MKRLSLVLLTGCVASACAGPDLRMAPPSSPEPPARSLRIRPDPIAFADTFVGCTRAVRVEFGNADTTRPLAVTRVSNSRPAFRLPGAAGLTLAAGETRALEAHFTPAKPGRVEGAVELTTDEVSNPRYPVAHTAMGIEPPSRPLDLVFVLDVSTSMDEIAILRDAMGVVFDAIEAASLDVQVGLTTFENDVIVHGRGSFLDRAAFFRELDSQLVEGSWIPDGNQPRQLLNFELEENLLDALHRSATEFDFRTEARRYLFLMTDDTYLEPPAVFSDGSRVIHSYLEVVSVLTARDISVFSAHRSAKGRGLSSDYDGGPSLVERTGGEWLELGNVQAASLARMLGGLLTRPDCR